MPALARSAPLVVIAALAAVASSLPVVSGGLGSAHPMHSLTLLIASLLGVDMLLLGAAAFLVARASHLRSWAFVVAAVGLVVLVFLLLSLSGIVAALALRAVASVIWQAPAWETLYQTVGVAVALPMRTLLPSLAISLVLVPLLLRLHRREHSAL